MIFSDSESCHSESELYNPEELNMENDQNMSNCEVLPSKNLGNYNDNIDDEVR